MATYFIVRRVRSQAWNTAAPMRAQALWAEHAAFMTALAADGFVILGGPVGTGEEEPSAGDRPAREECADDRRAASFGGNRVGGGAVSPKRLGGGGTDGGPPRWAPQFSEGRAKTGQMGRHGMGTERARDDHPVIRRDGAQGDIQL